MAIIIRFYQSVSWGFIYGIRKHSTGTPGTTLTTKPQCVDMFCLLGVTLVDVPVLFFG